MGESVRLDAQGVGICGRCGGGRSYSREIRFPILARRPRLRSASDNSYTRPESYSGLVCRGFGEKAQDIVISATAIVVFCDIR